MEHIIRELEQSKQQDIETLKASQVIFEHEHTNIEPMSVYTVNNYDKRERHISEFV